VELDIGNRVKLVCFWSAVYYTEIEFSRQPRPRSSRLVDQVLGLDLVFVLERETILATVCECSKHKHVLTVALTTHKAISLHHKFEKKYERRLQVIYYRCNVRLLFAFLLRYVV